MLKGKIAVIGLGNIGLPILYNIASRGYDVIGYDISEKRVLELKNAYDSNLSVEIDENINKKIKYVNDIENLKGIDFFFVCVQTQIDDDNNPDINIILELTKKLSKIIKKGSFVIYESTLFPGAIDDYIIPIFNEKCNYTVNNDYFVGYSPERINPGDKNNKLNNISKVISCDSKEGITILYNIYSNIIDAKLVIAPSVKHAEFTKVIENAQRYINIQFINEMAIISNSYGISIYEVLELCNTKWNFLNFKPGIVSGSCIPLAPLYLDYSGKKKKLNQKLINGAQDTQIGFKNFISNLIVKNLNGRVSNPKVLFIGLTYKANIPLFKGSKYLYIYERLIKENMDVYLYDPYITFDNIDFVSSIGFNKNKILIELLGKYDGICYFVDHSICNNIDFNSFLNKDSLFFDFNGKFSSKDFDNYISI